MTLETLASNDLPTFLIYDTINATQALQNNYPTSSNASLLLNNADLEAGMVTLLCAPSANTNPAGGTTTAAAQTALQSRRKKRRRARTCKNKEDAESQRMTHIAVERNRRRQMNEYLAVLRSLMPDSYIQRGDQASIVGGAIDFVKELEQLLQSLEAQKRALVQEQKGAADPTVDSTNNATKFDVESPPFAQFFSYPQYIWCHAPRDCPVPAEHQQSTVADIEVTLIETHANIRIMSPRQPGQLLKMVAGLQTLRLTILHLNVTTMDAMVLYSLSVKVEEGCNLTTVDDIAVAVHHILTLIEAEMAAMNP